MQHWSRTQSTIALSSAEAELNAILKMGQEMLGIRELLKEMGVNKELVINCDSSAAKGILSRRGSGKVKHLQVRQLWLQEKIGKKVIALEKIPRSQNTGDALTPHWTRAASVKHLRRMSAEVNEGKDFTEGVF